MIDALTTAILPVFAVAVLGFVLGRLGVVSETAPRELSRFTILLAVPALMVLLLANAPLGEFRWGVLAAYLAAEFIVFALAVFAATVLGRSVAERVLWGFAAAFVNHALYILPIAQFMNGDAAAIPVLALVVVDGLILIPGTILLLELSQPTGTRAGALQRAGLNPMTWSPILGLAINVLGIPLPEGLVVFLSFASAAAAPVALFALGVTLSFVALRGVAVGSLVLAFLSLVVQPICVWLLAPSDDGTGWSQLALFTAAGPCGMLAYQFALVYGAPHREISLAILITSVLSLVGLAFVAP